jgi:hypothetical protein
LRRNVLDLFSLWQQYGVSANVEHVKGLDNPADTLSRVAENTFSDLEVLEIQLTNASYWESFFGIPSYHKWRTQNLYMKAWLSARHKKTFTPTKELFCPRQWIQSAQNMDPRIRSLKEKLNNPGTSQELLYLKIIDQILVRDTPEARQLYLPDSLIQDVLQFQHKAQGHSSLIKLMNAFLLVCYHPHAKTFAKAIVRTCEACQLASARVGAATTYGPIQHPVTPFQTIGVDLFGPLSRRSGRNTGHYILTIVDRLTGYTLFMVVENGTAEVIARKLELFLLTLGQKVTTCVTDQGAQFVAGTAFHALLASWGVRHHIIPAYTPSCGGFYETRHKTAVHVLRTVLMDRPAIQWQLVAHIAAQQINSHCGSDRTSSPHELIFGWQYVHPSANLFATVTQTADEGTVSPTSVDAHQVNAEATRRATFRDELLRIWKFEFDKRQVEAAKRFETTIPGNRVPLQIGDEVYFANDIIKAKMKDQASGPFTLIQKMGVHTWQVIEIATKKKFIFHDRKLRKVEQVELPPLRSPIVDSIHAPQESPKTTERVQGTVRDKEMRSRRISEAEFLASIKGSSRYGRERRGSMNRIL